MIRLICAAVVLATAWLPSGDLRAEPAYTAKSGKIAFTVGCNIPLVKVSGVSTAIRGTGEATVGENTVNIHNLGFEVDPATFKTGIKFRDEHMYEKVFRASDGSMPKILLKAEHFQAKLNGQTSKWEGDLRAQVTMSGTTKPVLFHAKAEKKGAGAIIFAEGVVKTSDFGVKQISYAGATVNDEVKVTVSNLLMEP